MIIDNESASEKLKKTCLVCLEHAAKNEQILKNDVLDKVIKFVNSNIAQQETIVLYHGQNENNISNRTIEELKKAAKNPSIINNMDSNKTLQDFVTKIIDQYDQSTEINNS